MEPTELIDLSDSFLGKLVMDLLVAIVEPVRDLFGETVGFLLLVSLVVALPIFFTIVFYKMMMRWPRFFHITTAQIEAARPAPPIAYLVLIGWLALGVFGGGMGLFLAGSLFVAFVLAIFSNRR